MKDFIKLEIDPRIVLTERIASLVTVDGTKESIEEAVARLRSEAQEFGERRNWEAEIVERLALPNAYETDADVVDLFSGCGGLSLGFELQGFNVLAGFDCWPPAIEAYSKNFEHPGIVQDLRDSDSTISKIQSLPRKNELFGIVGGPPCQDFSLAGNRIEDKNADMTEKFAEIIDYFSPDFFVMENVPNALKAGAYQRALRILERQYETGAVVLNSYDYGVPQKRRRLFAFGAKQRDVTGGVLKRLRATPSGRRFSIADWFGQEIDRSAYYRHPRSYQRRGIFSVHEPSPTIRGVNRPVPSTYSRHSGDVEDPAFVEALTTNQRAQIQSFPSGFEFVDAKSHSEQMIGNAVPVRLASFVAGCVRTELSQCSGSTHVDYLF